MSATDFKKRKIWDFDMVSMKYVLMEILAWHLDILF